MFNKQLKMNIKALDLQIGDLTKEIGVADFTREDYDLRLKRLQDLTDLRNKLSENKVSESYGPAIVSGVIGVASILLVLKYEETNVVTSKAFSIATKLFRG